MASQLTIFNDALAEIGDHPLADLTTANTRLSELQARFVSAVEYLLAQVDWSFARARVAIAPVADPASFPPYTHRYEKPANYLRKAWLKAAADDDFQIDHAEVGANFYGYLLTYPGGGTISPTLEFISKAATNLDPANWPPQFARVLSLYLAFLVAPKLARAGDDLVGALWQKFQQAKAEAERQESVFLVNAQITSGRLPVMRRAIEILGQELAGSVAVYAHSDKLRWRMNRAWDQSVRNLLGQGAWNFATKRSLLSGGASALGTIPADSTAGIIEGYSVPPASPDSDAPDFAGYQYGYPLPNDFVHKVWIKTSAANQDECPFQILRNWVFVNYDPVVLEYISEDEFTTNPENWPPSFLEVAAAYLALTVAPEFLIDQGGDGRAKINQPRVREALEKNFIRKLSDARNKDAVQQYPKMPPVGLFVRARRGGVGFRYWGR